MSDSVNYGISGVQNITAQNIAVGANSKIEQNNWSDGLEQPLGDLRRAIEDFEGPRAARESLVEMQAAMVRELEVPVPDKGKILTMLSSIKDLAGPAATVVQAAAVLAGVIAAI
jgi:hypothetical protein